MIARGDTPRIARVTWTTVRVPFARPFATAHGALTHREGVLIAIEAEGGLCGVGEATPWPPFGLGAVGDALRVIAAVAPGLPGLPASRALDPLAGLDLAAPGVAAARCGLDLAAHDLIGQAQGATVAALLGSGDGVREVPVNATIGALPPGEAARVAAAAVAAGFGCLKVKVGAPVAAGHGSLAADEARVAAVRAAVGPAALIRLDANGAWGEAEAIAAINRLARYDLELVEQPVAPEDPAALARVRRGVNAPIAADEAVRSLGDARRIVALGAADLLVVKPMVCGGLLAGRAILDLATDAGLGTFVTTTIDFGPGIAGALALGASGGRATRHCGLATADFLASSLVRAVPAVAGGAMRLPTAAGSGVALDREAVERYRVGGGAAGVVPECRD